MPKVKIATLSLNLNFAQLKKNPNSKLFTFHIIVKIWIRRQTRAKTLF